MPSFQTIDAFRGQYAFLSNFHPAKVWLGGKLYPTVEHAFQAAKTEDPEERERIRQAATPGKAKRMGQNVKLRYGWEENKQDVMLFLCLQKFRKNPLRRLLLRTGSAKLVEVNTWGDTYWGVCNGVGKNALGKILMDIRVLMSEQWL